MIQVEMIVQIGRDIYTIKRATGQIQSEALDTATAAGILADAYYELQGSLLERMAPSARRKERVREELVERANDIEPTIKPDEPGQAS